MSPLWLLLRVTCFLLLLGSPVAMALNIVFRPQWILDDHCAGEMYAADKFRRTRSTIRVTLLPYDETEDQYTAVVKGRVDVSTSEAITLLQKIEHDRSDLVIIGMKDQITPAGYLSLKGQGIVTPKNIEGKVIGLYSDNTLNHFRWFCKLHGIDIQTVRFRKITSDNIKSLLDGEVDVIIAHDTNEPIVLKRMGYETNFIPMYGPGAVYYGSVYFCRRAYFKQHAAELREFVKAVAEGWKWAIAHPEETAVMVMQYYPKARYLMSSHAFTEDKVIRGITVRAFHLTYNVGVDCIGCISRTQWDIGIQELVRHGLVHNNGRLRNVVQYDLARTILQSKSIP